MNLEAEPFIDSNVEKIFELVAQLESGSPEAQGILSELRQSLDTLVGEFSVWRVTRDKTEQRLNEILDTILAIASLDFTQRASISDEGNVFDAVATGMNALGEELQVSTVSKTYLDDIITSMIDTLIVLNPDKTIQMVNQATLDLLGYKEEELLDQSVEMIFAAETLSKLGPIDIIKTGPIRNIETIYRAKDGRHISMSFSGSVIRSAYGQVQGIVCVAQNITERVQAVEALRRHNRELTILYGAANVISSNLSLDAVLETVADQMIQAFEAEGCALSLWDHERNLIETLVDFSAFWPDETEPPGTIYDLNNYPATRRVLETRQPLLIQHDNPTADEAELVLMEEMKTQTLLMLPLIARDRVVGLVELFERRGSRDYYPEDIHLVQSLATQAAVAIENAHLYQQVQHHTEELEQRVAERTTELQERITEVETLNRAMTNLLEDLQAANHITTTTAHQLEEANKELAAFAYSVSHDLRAPLRSIDGFSQALLEDYNDQLDEVGQDYLRRVRTATQRMGQLIDDILHLSRITRSEMRRRRVDLSELAGTIARELQQAQPEQQVEFVIAKNVIVEGDRQLLQLALENLIGNAWKFTQEQAYVKIEFGPTSHKGQPAYFVRDNGVGFDMVYADRLFGPFQRLHSQQEFEGAGIGLATVQRIIHRHGGQIWAQSTVGEGATFYFTLS